MCSQVKEQTSVIAGLSLTLKLGLLEHLDLADVHIMQRIDGLTGLLNVLANTVWDPGT